MRILSITPLYPTPTEPGAGTFVRSRLQALGKHAEVTVVSPQSLWSFHDRKIWVTPSRPYRIQDGELTILSPRWAYPPVIGALNPAFLVSALFLPVLRIRQSFPFDMIDAHFGFPTGIAACVLSRLFGVPFVITLRGSETVHAEYPCRRTLLKKSLKRASRLITVSRRLKDFAVALGASEETVVVIPNGVDTKRFCRRDRGLSRADLGIPPSVPMILTAGHLIELKGHHHVIEALGDLPGVHLYIAGGRGGVASNEATLHRMVEERGLNDRVHFLGHLQPDLLAMAMAAADVFCLASSREGWPNVVHEALSSGTPVVATDVGAIPDMIPNETCGLIVPIANQQRLTDALRTALSKNWDRDAIARWGSKRSWDEVGKEVRAVLGEAVSAYQNK
jgi:teichuronic acid biosynthesis glycosyltransferase TuaC